MISAVFSHIFWEQTHDYWQDFYFETFFIFLYLKVKKIKLFENRAFAPKCLPHVDLAFPSVFHFYFLNYIIYYE